ncbi:transporter [Chryseosolibacter indicus]|uniref:Transporter n=1 Tax=Chryseosolibacter indicus TaxID=2782351 RepID=A0ABS5VU99_9BACT|nr:transporter [Chryseosolibacter indicus]MBT1704771.1 transporter [Chryseosolibacter indicus]
MIKLLRNLLMGLLPLTSMGQTVTDGLMMAKNDLCTGVMYTRDHWSEYWEGELKRKNDNIGKLTTQSLMWVGAYGLSTKVNLIAMLPYVKTEASQGTLHHMEGIQDLTLAVKYNFFRHNMEKSSFRTFATLAVSTPLSDYTPDYFPLSVGTGTTNISYRATAFYKFANMFFANATGAYTWRSNTTLDRPAYYTNDNLYLTDEVKMPNVFDYAVSIGYLRNGLQAEINYMQQNTLGGSDIRRQDMPFVSNRMNFSKVGALVMYYLPKPKGLALRGSYTTTVAGRNVGQSNTFMGGALYTIHFSKKP